MPLRCVIFCAVAVVAAAAVSPERPPSTAAHVAGVTSTRPPAKKPGTRRRPTRATRPAALPASPNDPLWSSSWGLRALGVPALWRLGLGSPAVVVAVLDTGLDPSQRDLAGALVPGWNTLTDSADTSDTNGHGTAVAGVIAARANNGLGGSGYCPRCSIMPVKVVDGSGRGTSVTIAAGIRWAVAHGANVINLSLILSGRDPDVTAAVADAVARGVVVVAAAGNDGGTGPNYPAGDPGAIGVAGTDPSGALYPWSNHGAWVTVSAPGCNEAPALGGGYQQFCGTSSATAATTGVVALALADCRCPGAQVSGALAATAAAGAPPRLDAGAMIGALATASNRG